jgi:hypothetical protein
MRIWLYTICWNEEVLLPHFLQHYSLCERIIIYDNQSTDQSRNIINSFSNTEIRQYWTNNEIRDDLYLEIKNNAWKEARNIADYVIVCDIDEFLYPLTIKKDRTTLIKAEGYMMYADKTPSLFPIIYEQFIEGVKWDKYSKTCIFNPTKILEINYQPGAHTCNPTGVINYGTPLKLLHYSYLGEKYQDQRYASLKKRLGNRFQWARKQYSSTPKQDRLWIKNKFKHKKNVL